MSIPRFAALILTACVALAANQVRAAQPWPSEMVVNVYGVADLVLPEKGGETTEKSLMNLISNLVDPASWENQGGEASVQFFPLGYGLVVRQSSENQDRVANVLEELRNPTCKLSPSADCGNCSQCRTNMDKPFKVGEILFLSVEVTSAQVLQRFPETCASPQISYPTLRQGSSLARLGLFDVPEIQSTATDAKPHKVGEILITGNDETPNCLILDLLDGIYPGQPIDYPAMRQCEIRLFNSGLFDLDDRPTVTTIEREEAFNSEYKDILVHVKEKQSIHASMIRMLWKTKQTLPAVKEWADYCTKEIAGWFVNANGVDSPPEPEILEQPTIESPRLVQRIYQVTDLVTPHQANDPSQLELDKARWEAAIRRQMFYAGVSPPDPYPLGYVDIQRTAPCPCPSQSKPSNREPLQEQLVRLITRAIDPTSWSDAGGKATIQYFPIGNALVVNQTEAIQEQIAKLLEELRHLQDVEVAVEMRLVSVPPNLVGQICKAADVPTTPCCDGQEFRGVATLDGDQVSRFLNAAQGNRRTDIMQAPKLTVFNGQTATINVGDEVETIGIDFEKVNGQAISITEKRLVSGFSMDITPVVSADQSEVRSHFSFVNRKINGPQTGTPDVETVTLDSVIKLADGKTALLHVGKMNHEHRAAARTPLLSRLPVIGRHFQRSYVESEEDELFLLITTRVIISDEEQLEFRGNLRPPIPR